VQSVPSDTETEHRKYKGAPISVIEADQGHAQGRCTYRAREHADAHRAAVTAGQITSSIQLELPHEERDSYCREWHVAGTEQQTFLPPHNEDSEEDKSHFTAVRRCWQFVHECMLVADAKPARYVRPVWPCACLPALKALTSGCEFPCL
jgi:hypothetical protein